MLNTLLTQFSWWGYLLAKDKYLHQLTSDEEVIIKEGDRPRTSVIKGLPARIRQKVYNSLIDLPSDDPNYYLSQCEWLEKKIYLTSEKECRDVSSDNLFLNDIKGGSACEEFRIDYALTHTEKVRSPWTKEFRKVFVRVKEAELKSKTVK